MKWKIDKRCRKYWKNFQNACEREYIITMDHKIEATAQYSDIYGNNILTILQFSYLSSRIRLDHLTYTCSKQIYTTPEFTVEKLDEFVSNKLTERLIRNRECNCCDIFGFIDDIFIEFKKSHNIMNIMCSGHDSENMLNSILKNLDKYIIRERHPDEVNVFTAYMGEQKIAVHDQIIKCKQFRSIINNYPDKIINGINRLINLNEPWNIGKLIIWNGQPGTGKTYAIRSLIRHFKQTMRACIITDPEQFLGRPSYYYNLTEQFQNDKILFILEDNADLVMRESRGKNYGLSRLLNLTDGLIGQGRDDIFMITFNEEIGKIDPAFLRPGRKLQHLQFECFDYDGSREWLIRNGMEESEASKLADNDLTLAELYAKLNNIVDDEDEQNKRLVGFSM